MRLLLSALLLLATPAGAQQLRGLAATQMVNRLPAAVGEFVAASLAPPPALPNPLPGGPPVVGGMDRAVRPYAAPDGSVAEVVYLRVIGAAPMPDGADSQAIRGLIETEAGPELQSAGLPGGWARRPGFVPLGTSAETGLLCVVLERFSTFPAQTRHICGTGRNYGALFLKMTQAATGAEATARASSFMLPVAEMLRTGQGLAR